VSTVNGMSISMTRAFAGLVSVMQVFVAPMVLFRSSGEKAMGCGGMETSPRFLRLPCQGLRKRSLFSSGVQVKGSRYIMRMTYRNA